MATTFKTLTANDITNTRTLLHEAIPLTGTIVSGTYADANIKSYSHGLFKSVFDYPYLSSSANHIFDVAVGISTASAMSASDETAADAPPQQAKKVNMYNQMAQVLAGHDSTGKIMLFGQDGTPHAVDDGSGLGHKMNEVFFVNFARLLSKDEIKKGSFSITFITGGTPDVFVGPTGWTLPGDGHLTMSLGDHGAATAYKASSPAGEFGLLYTSSANINTDGTSAWGHIYYQAGIAVITGGIWCNPLQSAAGLNGTGKALPSSANVAALHTTLGKGLLSASFNQLMTGGVAARADSTIPDSMDFLADSVINRIQNISFNNTVELNSTIYFCRANHNEFNYSANPTYLNQSQIRVKNTTSDNPVSYITTIGLYSSDNELLAVAKVSEPLKKDPNTELTLRVRLDY